MDRLVLLIDDDDDHAELVRRAFARHGSGHALVRFLDGEQAVASLSSSCDGDGPLPRVPDVVLLDLRLPRISGLEVLRHIRASSDLRYIPVVVFSTSDAPTDIASAYEGGANAYVVKPGTFSRFREVLRDLSQFWLACNRSPHGTVQGP